MLEVGPLFGLLCNAFLAIWELFESWDQNFRAEDFPNIVCGCVNKPNPTTRLGSALAD